MNRFAISTIAVMMTAVPVHAADNGSLIGKSWDEIVEMARGGEVNWHLWGGADSINSYVSDYIGGILKRDYDINLNRVGLNDTRDAVNLVLSEFEAGKEDDSGSVDLIWINGENFRTMKQASLAYCGYASLLPNNKLVDWDDPAIAYDFGVPVDGCEMPWNRVQFAFAYDTARMANPPNSIPSLLDWIDRNPGRFTYPAPPDFTGAVFLRHLFYHAAGGVENLLGPFDQERFDEVSDEVFAILEEIEPKLWRAGKTYPKSLNEFEALFAQSEVDLYFSYEPATVGTHIDDGIFPPTVRGFAMVDGSIANTSYVVIPVNAANKAEALVVQNLLLSADAQYHKALPEIWGTSPGISLSRTDAETQQRFAAIESHPAVVRDAELEPYAVPELHSDWIDNINAAWRKRIAP